MKTALVTGASRGLGYAWALALAERGYRVILTARDRERADRAAEVLNAREFTVYPREMDVSDEGSIASVADWVKEMFGHIDLIVNNAGVNPKDFPDRQRMAASFYLDQLRTEDMLDVIRINSLAPLIVVKHFRALLRKSESPMVVNISSWLGSVNQLHFGGHYGYVGSKNLLNILNRSMANELRPDGIISINVNPGWVKTDMGGSKASFTPSEAVDQLIENVLSRVTLEDTGMFFHYDGSLHPW